ncbi:hypothetical protein RRSWK_06666 [Rhodopirellula sp. SWK7]|nr:hypothetical protein RRSWK_06666 [Rhodopirellula sp. SWK7]
MRAPFLADKNWYPIIHDEPVHLKPPAITALAAATKIQKITRPRPTSGRCNGT